jgi:hypothetical protein
LPEYVAAVTVADAGRLGTNVKGPLGAGDEIKSKARA